MTEFGKPKLVYVTAGAGGMYCGSCLHDNALAKALAREGWDVQLVPLYTPIRTDEQDFSVDQVFLGGINVYLQQKIPLFRYLPEFLDRVLDNPRFIRRVTSRAIEIDAAKLGDLTLSVLRGSHGNQRKEIGRFVKWLDRDIRPGAIIVSNVLVAGFIPELKRRRPVHVLVTLQGDDVFLNGLTPEFRAQCLAEIQKLDAQIDGYLVHSTAFADHMARYLLLPREKMHVTPLGIDTTDFESVAADDSVAVGDGSAGGSFKIGYLARLAPEKGLHHLVDAFLKFKKLGGTESARLEVAGWLGPQHQRYVDEQFLRLTGAGLNRDFRYWGVVDRRQKLQFLRQISLLSVPTDQAEPKGLFVLEALASGKPVVQPRIGAFPEMLEPTDAGILVPPRDADALANAWHELMLDPERGIKMGQRGREFVFAKRNSQSMVRATEEVLFKTLGKQPV